MEALPLGSEAFIKEAARRGKSGGPLGKILFSDPQEAAELSGLLSEPIDWNSETYLGPKTFQMTPGDTFALMLVPNGTVEEVFNDPAIGGNKRPLFSIGTANPNDALHLGQVADINGIGSAFVMEDLRADTGSDKDYDDVVFEFKGAKGFAVDVGKVISPNLDWRDGALGRELIDSVTPSAPTVTVALANDTGHSDIDGVTSDLTLAGTVTSNSNIAQLTAQFKGQAIPVDITSALSPDGSFVLDGDLLETIKGAPLEDGDRTIILQAVSTEGVSSEPVEINAIFDHTPPTIIFGLTADFDTPPVGDSATKISPVTLGGQTEAGSKVVLVEIGEEKIADATGKFQFSDVELILGENTFNLEVTDAAGNKNQISQTITRAGSEPIIAASLANDTGASNSDSITSDPTIVGTVTDESAITSLVARLVGEIRESPLHEITDLLSDNGSFSLNLEKLEQIYQATLPDGSHKLYLQATDALGNISALEEFSFVLARSEPSISFDLEPDSDTEPLGDGQTTSAIATLAGETSLGSSVVLRKTGATATADDLGKFAFTGVELALGENSLTVEVTDLAGNTASLEKTIIRIEESSEDTDPPVISALLLNDSGSSDSDSITSDPSLKGSIVDNSSITLVEASLNNGDWLDITAYLGVDGSLELTEANYSQIFGSGSLADGSHSLRLRATDQFQNSSEIKEIPFVLDTVVEPGNFGLHPDFDSDPIGDGQTDQATVTLAGQAEAGSSIELLETGAEVIASEGAFEFAEVSLVPGNNSFTATITDIAGNEQTIEKIFTRFATGDNNPTLTNLGLEEDTGENGSDSITGNPTVVGTISEKSDLVWLAASLNDQPHIDVDDAVAEDGTLTLDRSRLESILGSTLVDGAYELSLQGYGENGLAFQSSLQFVLDATAPEIAFGLAPDFDSAPSGDGQTIFQAATLAGRTEAGNTVVLKETGETVTANSLGRFEFAWVDLAVGENSFTVETSDIAGNFTELLVPITRLEVTQENSAPVISDSKALVHKDLEETIFLDEFVSDPDGDPIFYTVSNPTNGTVELLGDGETIFFRGAPGFSGEASFDLVATDARGATSSGTLFVNVSDAPLLYLNIIPRDIQLDAGESGGLFVTADFADELGVLVPLEDLSFSTDNPELLSVDSSGLVTASSAEGVGIVRVQYQEEEAVTAIRIGELPTPENDAELNVALAEFSGIDPYPDAVTLTPGGTRQILISLNEVFEGPELNSASSGTNYYVSDPEVLSVTADGLIEARAEGYATVTAVNGAAEEVIRVRVDAPAMESATLGIHGGVVEASDGGMVMVPPGALEEDSNVSLAPVAKEDLSLEFPSGFSFAGAFNLEFDDERLDLPAQLALPAPGDIEAGTEVYFMRKGALPDEEGNWNTAWLIEESGKVDADGMIRTTSPPWPGIVRPGEYIVAYSGKTGSATIVQGQLTVSYSFPLAFYGIILPGQLPSTSEDNQVGMLIDVAAGRTNFNDPNEERRGNWGGLLEGPYLTIPAFTISYDISSLKTFAVPAVGLPIVSDVGVQRNDKGIAEIDARLPVPAPEESDPLIAPVLQEAALTFEDEAGEALPEPVLFLSGTNVLVDEDELDDPLGSRFEDLIVKFYMGEGVYEGAVLPDLSEDLGDNQFKVAVSVPDTVALGSSRIALGRRQNQVVGQNGTQPVYEEVEYEGNTIRLDKSNEYVFAAMQRADMVAVLEGGDPESIVEETESADILLSRIPVGNPETVGDRPRDLAVTNDGTRVYVALEGSGQVALVDPMVLRQVDTQISIEGVNAISLPDGASPKAIAIDSRDNYAYIADGKRGEIYVLDVNPASDAFHQVIQTISFDAAPGALRSLAIDSSGRKLFATAIDSYIYVVNIDPSDRPVDPRNNDRKWHEQIGAIETVTGTNRREEIGRIPSATGADGISATADPNKLIFVNGNRTQDGKGFGVIEIINDDLEEFEVKVSYLNLGIGSFSDYFDVNEGVSVAITRDNAYAFVAGRNIRGFIGGSFDPTPNDPRKGSNIGIIKDPLGPNPQLIAATRPIPKALTADLVVSNDDRYLYASYPTSNGSGDVFVLDIEEIVRTLEEPSEFQIDHLDRGVGSPFFNTSSAREVTAEDFKAVPIDDINPQISIAADYEIVEGDWARRDFTFNVPEDTVRGPVGTRGFPLGVAASPPDLVELIGPIGSSEPDDEPTTPTFNWEFGIPSAEVDKVNLFVSTFPEGEGLLPWDPVINLSEVLPDSSLNEGQKRELLSSQWEGHDDFNPNRILTASWTENDGWVWNGGNNYTSDNTSFTLETGRTLSAGQTYYWGLEVFDESGTRDLKLGKFDTPFATNDDSPFSSVTVLTHGAVPPVSRQAGISARLFDMAGDIVDSGGGGLLLRYNKPTGLWILVNRYGGFRADFPEGLNPEFYPDYQDRLSNYIFSNYANKPLVLLPDWGQDFESAIPDSGFSEGAADAFYAALVRLDQALGGTVGERDSEGELVRIYDNAGELIRAPGGLFKSPTHLIGFSRGTVVNSELAQRLLTVFPSIGGTSPENRDFQMTTIDPHDFDQEGLSWPIIGGFRNFYEPKIQVWDGITFADNYYQTTADPGSNVSLTPNGRDIPYLLPPEDSSDAPGLQFPTDPDGNLLGFPDLRTFLGTRSGEDSYPSSRTGFSRETDPIPVVGGGLGATHGRVLTWYEGTANLGLRETQPSHAFNWSDDPVDRRRSDGHYEVLFDEDFYNAYPNRVNPWYVPEHVGANFENIPEQAPWEGIGTGWFYSALGGGIERRPYEVDGLKRSRDEIDNFEEFLSSKRVPLHFDNTHSASMRGDVAIPTLFNGNFDAVFQPDDDLRNLISSEVPGWSFHNGDDGLLTSKLVDWGDIPKLKQRYENGRGVEQPSYLETLGIDPSAPDYQANYAVKLDPGDVITHNRFVVPDWGALRFNLHVPTPAAPIDQDSRIRIVLIAEGGEEHELHSPDFPSEAQLDLSRRQDSDPREANNPTLPAVDLREVSRLALDVQSMTSQVNRIGFGSRGFETFQVEVPPELRGKVGTLKFELHGNTSAYLDDVFFKGVHLRFGNPVAPVGDGQEARQDPSHQPNNYLIENPQYASSHNEDYKTPNWVSYQLNQSWENNGAKRKDLSPRFVGDFTLPSPPLTRVTGEDNYDRYQRGHLAAAEDRARSVLSYHPDTDPDYNKPYPIVKDYYQTFLMTNVEPQNIVSGTDDPWTKFEKYLLEELVHKQGKELYITAGRDGEQRTFPSGPGNISVPSHVWKVVLVMDEPGRGLADVTPNTKAFAFDVPNDDSVTRPGVNPVTGLPWSDWRNYIVSINNLEDVTGYDFLSNIPKEIQETIEDNTIVS